MSYGKVSQIRSTAQLRERLSTLGIELPLDDEVLTAQEHSPLAEPAKVGTLQIGNRWCIHPMEGWDAERDGSPSELTLRRWRRFGQSGAKLIWGGEAAAVRPDGRANPNQTMAIASNEKGLAALKTELLTSHQESFGTLEGLVVGLQLTHSGRYCRPERKDRVEPRIAYHHPLLDARVGVQADDDTVVWTDGELEGLIEDYVAAARLAHRLGFVFVDIKACHGYLLHEFLSARRRPGAYGGDLEGRARLLLRIIDAVRGACPGLEIGVRLSLFDGLPYEQRDGHGQPVPWPEGTEYDCGFGCSPTDPSQIDLSEPIVLLDWLAERGVRMINITAGSPYSNPHYQRPAIFPPSDGYSPPEDPLCGVARQIKAVAEVKSLRPDLFFVGSGYTYLQEYLPHVAQAAVRAGHVDSVGLGRMVLSYPEFPADVLRGTVLQRKLICRTFSDCTTAPRKGMVSGCYPLDAYYKARPEREALVQIKSSDRSS